MEPVYRLPSTTWCEVTLLRKGERFIDDFKVYIFEGITEQSDWYVVFDVVDLNGVRSSMLYEDVNQMVQLVDE